MSLALDASMTLAWLIQRADAAEAALAKKAFGEVITSGAQVPALWHAEIANTLLVFERAGKLREQESAVFLSDLGHIAITEDDQPRASVQARVLGLGRRYGLTAYDATYLELALRTGRTLATFDRQLAEAARATGGRVFGDAA